MLSIIIPTLNEEENIEKTLNKIQKISNKIDLNIVVVDDNSKDNTLKLVQLFKEKLDIDQDIATVLAEEGFASLDEVAYVPLEEMADIDGFDEDLVEELRTRAKDALLTMALTSDQDLKKPAEDLLEMEGMDQQLADNLANSGIISMEDLA